jgi:hypothetical protein
MTAELLRFDLFMICEYGCKYGEFLKFILLFMCLCRQLPGFALCMIYVYARLAERVHFFMLFVFCNCL